VRDGSNGFSCFVDRQNPLNLEPTCFDAEGSATTLLSRFYAEEQRAKGKSEEEIKAGIEEGYKTGKFQAPRKPGIVYMMSDKGCLLVPGNKLVHMPPHLMFYAPYATDKDIGAPPAAANMPHPDSRGATRRGRDRVSESRGPLRLEGAHNSDRVRSSSERILVGAGAVNRRYKRADLAKVHSELAAVVIGVIQHDRPE